MAQRGRGARAPVWLVQRVAAVEAEPVHRLTPPSLSLPLSPLRRIVRRVITRYARLPESAAGGPARPNVETESRAHTRTHAHTHAHATGGGMPETQGHRHLITPNLAGYHNRP